MSKADVKMRLTSDFKKRFQRQPEIFLASPGRMEMIGNHTDYNHGLCLAAALDFLIEAAIAPTDDMQVVAESQGTRRIFRVDLNDLAIRKSEFNRTEALIRGVANGFKTRGYQIGGLQIYAISDIPRGAGVSSSAAYELLIASAFNILYNDGKIPPLVLAQIAQEAEVNYFHKPCGLLDQTSVAFGGLVFLDFASTTVPKVTKLEFALPGYDLVLVNTGSHSSLTAYYKEARDDIFKVVSHFGVHSLREIPLAQFEAELGTLYQKVGGRAINRAFHVFSENERVLQAKVAFEKQDIPTILKCIRGSGASSLALLQNLTYPSDTEQGLLLAYNLSLQAFPQGAFRVHGGGFAGTLLGILPQKQTAAYIAKMSAVFGKENILRIRVRNLGPALF
ncbi:MAG: galactokinase [Bacilli bacterium]|jgi:galactokinase